MMQFKHLNIPRDPFLEGPVINVPTETADHKDLEAMTPLEGEGNDAFKTEYGEDPIVQFWEFKSMTDDELQASEAAVKKANDMLGLRTKIATEGLVDRFQAQSIDAFVPDFYVDHGAGTRFTYTPSLEGVTYAMEALDSAIRDGVRTGFKKVAEWAVNLYNRLAEMINKFIERMTKAGQVGNDNLISQLNEKNAKTFAGAGKIVDFLDEASGDADKVIALLMSGLRESVQDGTADQEASIERASEIYKQQFEVLAGKVGEFKKALGNSPYGKKLMGQVDDSGTPTMEDIQHMAAGVKKLAAAMAALQNINSPEELSARMQELVAAQDEYKEALQDTSNKGEAVQQDLSNHKLADLYKQTSQFTGADKSNVDMASVKASLDTINAVRDSIKNIAAIITKFGERVAGMEGIDQSTVNNAQAALQSTAAMIGKLVTSVVNAADAMGGSTQGKVWVVSQFVKLINMAPVVIQRGCGPLSADASNSVKENALRHFGIQLTTGPSKPQDAAGGGADSFM